MIQEKSRKLQDALVKDTREAYGNYNDEQLACLLADKRLKDYKTALTERGVQSIYSIGSTSWIIQQDKSNRKALAEIPSIDEFLAALTSHDIVQGMLTKDAA